jgi:dihydroorotate dehydrogenase electron transfer subunit
VADPERLVVHPERPRTLLIGADAGIGPLISLAERLRGATAGKLWKPLVLMGSDAPFPFRTRPSTLILPGIPTGVIACMPQLEARGIPNRLASTAGFPGCFDGIVTDLAAAWLQSLGPAELAEVEILACGPMPLLDAAAQVAQRYGVSCETVTTRS